MGKFDKIMDMFGFNEDEYEEELENEGDYEEYEVEEEEEPEKKSFFSFGRKKTEEPEEEPEEQEAEAPKATSFAARRSAYRSSYSNNKVVSMSGKTLELTVVKPYTFSDATEVAENLAEGRAVVINMEDLKNPEAQRSIDFICGVVYALNGSLQAINKRIFIAAPTEVSVDGDILEEIMRSGFAPNFND